MQRATSATLNRPLNIIVFLVFIQNGPSGRLSAPKPMSKDSSTLLVRLSPLREKLREFYLEETDYEKRALASLSAVELDTVLLKTAPTLAAVGLQVKLLTTPSSSPPVDWRIANKPPSLLSGLNRLMNSANRPWRCWSVWPSSSRRAKARSTGCLAMWTSGTWSSCCGRQGWLRGLAVRMGGYALRRRGSFCGTLGSGARVSCRWLLRFGHVSAPARTGA